jgi:hypothetical protein
LFQRIVEATASVERQLLSNDSDTFVDVRDGRIVDRNVGISTSHQRQVNFASTSMSATPD